MRAGEIISRQTEAPLEKLLVAMSSGDYFWTRDERLSEMRARDGEILKKTRELFFNDREAASALMATALCSFGRGAMMVTPMMLRLGYNLSVGRDSFSNHDLIMDNWAEVILGERLFIGPRVSFFTALPPDDPELRAAGILRALPITVEDDVWIGGRCAVCAGVTIGKGSVVAAGSVVTESIPPGVVALGNPCRVLRPITDKDRISI